MTSKSRQQPPPGSPILTERPGQLVHLDVKRIGAVPTGGGWRVHGRGSRTVPPANSEPATATALRGRRVHPARLQRALSDERPVTAAGFLRRATVFFTAHSVTVENVLTDSGSCYRSKVFDAALPDGARYTLSRPQRPRRMGRSSVTTGPSAPSSSTPDPGPSETPRRLAATLAHPRQLSPSPHRPRPPSLQPLSPTS